MNRRVLSVAWLPVLATVLLLATRVFAAVPGAADREAIIQVIWEANILADRVYTVARRHHRAGTLATNRGALIAAGKADMRRILTDDLAARLEKTWVEDQMDDVATGPDQIDYGVSRLDVKELTIAGNKAQVTADVHKYLVDRIERNGRRYRDRMEGKTMTRATLVRARQAWKISDLELEPDLSATRHIQIPEAMIEPAVQSC